MPTERTTISVHGDVYRELKARQREGEPLCKTARRAVESLDEQEPSKEVKP